MGRVLDFLRRARDLSIWGPGAFSSEDERVRDLIRITLPRFYALIAVFGAFGAIGGTPALRQTFGDQYARGWSVLILVTALACIAGNAYPKRLWRVELVGAMLLNSLIFAYIAALIIASILVHDLGRAGVAAILFSGTELPWWRVKDIFHDRSRNGWK